MSAAAASVAGPFSAPAANFKTRASNCVLLTISVIAMCVLIVCGVKIVREYSLARGYQAATCHVVLVDYAEHDIECFFCGAGAKDKTKEKGAGSCVESLFPCLEVHVEYRSKQFGIREGILHPDSIQSNGIFGKCSYDICLKKEEENRVKVEEWAQPWRAKHERKERFECYFNTENPNDVITEKKHTGNEVIHSMVWPCLIILICGIIFIYMETQRRGMNFCGDGHSKRGLADGAEDNLHGSETMLRWQPGKDRAECQLVTGSNDAANVSSSMSSLERLQKVDDPLLSNGRPGASKSADNVKNNKVNNSSDTKALLPESDTNTLSRIAIVVDPPSTGNRDGLPV